MQVFFNKFIIFQMSVKIRLQRHGRAKAPFYHIVIADSRAPRDGKFIEKIGTYNPMTKPATIDIDRELAYQWLTKGAQPTDTVSAILRFKGVMFRKHLMRGVAKGSMTEEQAMVKYNAWIEAKEKNISDTSAKTQADKKAFHEKVFGKAKAKPVVVAPVVEAPVAVEEAPAVVEAVAPVVVEEAPAAIEPVGAEETPVVAETTTTTSEADEDPELAKLPEA